MPKLHTAADLSTYPSARASSLARPPSGYLRQPTCARCAVRRNPLSNSRTVGASVDDSIDSVATWNVSWRNAVVEGKREAATEQHYLVLFGPSTGNPSLFGPSYVRRALLCFSSYTYLVVMMKYKAYKDISCSCVLGSHGPSGDIGKGERCGSCWLVACMIMIMTWLRFDYDYAIISSCGPQSC